MAVIEKIRSKSGLLIGIIGFSLVAFVLGDLFSSKNGFFGGSDNTVGIIGGNKVDLMDYNSRVEEFVENYKTQTQNQTVDQATMDQIREQAWNKFVNDYVMVEQYKKLGLTCSADELFDMVQGKNIDPQIRQAFTDPKTGQFNPSAVIQFLKNKNQDPKTAAQWAAFEKALKEGRVAQKYTDLIKGGLYVTKDEAKANFVEMNRTASVRYVMIPYSSVVDTTIQVSDADLKAVYNENLKKYKQADSRTVEYVTFNIKPSDMDVKSASNDFARLFEDFKTSTNDSAFIAANSDQPLDNNFPKRGTLPFNIDSAMFSAAVGTVMGPFDMNGTYSASKLMAVKTMADSVKARHILIKVEPGKMDAAKVTADSIIKAIKGGAKFEDMATKYSIDQAANAKGGDLGWFDYQRMVQPFSEACFGASKGALITAETQFGLHVIEVTDMSAESRQVKVATLLKKVEPSAKTMQTIFTKANEFANKFNTADAFDKGIKEQNLTKLSEQNIQENNRQVGGFENSRELIRWSFKAKLGEVSKAFDFGNAYVVAKLTDIREKGTSTLEQVKDQVTAEARKEKKAQMFIDQLSKAGTSNIDAVAASAKQTVMTAESISFGSPFIGNAGFEGAVVGNIMTLKAGQVSKPIKGNSGVYVVVVNNFNDPSLPADFKDSANQLKQQLQGRAQYEVENALKEKADITDHRGRFY
ncbi:MAG: SurA N-terminal domain-containing protein [Bacteroidota bacterium]